MIEAASHSHRRTGCQTLRGLLVSLAGVWICAAQAQPNAEAVAQMEALRQSEAQAREFASGATLVSQTVTPLPSPPAPSNASMAGGAAQ